MKYFLAFSEQSLLSGFYSDMIKVAVKSAQQSTELQPHFIFDGSACELTDWLSERNVPVCLSRSRFFPYLKEIADKTHRPEVFWIGSGAFLRFEIPSVMASLGLDDEYVLYTDCDVLFQHDPVPMLKSLAPRVFAVAPEFDPTDWVNFNSGVMLMNVPAFRAALPQFEAFCEHHLDTMVLDSYDQAALRAYFGQSADRLPVELNWKPYWGRHDGASIIHFHGPKPFHRFVDDYAYPHLLNDQFLEYAKAWDAVLASTCPLRGQGGANLTLRGRIEDRMRALWRDRAFRRRQP